MLPSVRTGSRVLRRVVLGPQATDPSAELGTFNVSWLSNIQLNSSTPTTESITDGPPFTKDAYEQFTATQSSSHGTEQVHGLMAVALDPNNFEVFAVYEAVSTAEYNENSKAAIAMLISATG